MKRSLVKDRSLYDMYQDQDLIIIIYMCVITSIIDVVAAAAALVKDRSVSISIDPLGDLPDR